MLSSNCNTKNEMKWVLGQLCAHVCWAGPRKPSEDGEMKEMTLPSRQRIQNSSPGSLRASTLPLDHRGSPQYWILRVSGEEAFCFFKTWMLDRGLKQRSPTFQAGGFNPLNPHDALKHHFTSLKTDLIFQQPRVLERKFPKNNDNFLYFFTHFKSSSSTTSRELRQQFAACSGWRWQW